MSGVIARTFTARLSRGRPRSPGAGAAAARAAAQAKDARQERHGHRVSEGRRRRPESSCCRTQVPRPRPRRARRRRRRPGRPAPPTGGRQNYRRRVDREARRAAPRASSSREHVGHTVASHRRRCAAPTADEAAGDACGCVIQRPKAGRVHRGAAALDGVGQLLDERRAVVKIGSHDSRQSRSSRNHWWSVWQSLAFAPARLPMSGWRFLCW